MSRDWTKKELKAVSKAMKEEGYMSFGEFCKKGKFIYPEGTQNTANAANTTNTAAEVAPMKHLTFTVAECGEYHSVGRYRDDIATVEEAIDIYVAYRVVKQPDATEEEIRGEIESRLASHNI